MIGYHTALAAFPSIELTQRIVLKEDAQKPDVIQNIRSLLQMALLSPLANSNLNERIVFVKGDVCILRPFKDTVGKTIEITFTEADKDLGISQSLAHELRMIAKTGIDIEGHGVICLEGDTVVYVPLEKQQQSYGNIILFDPYFRASKG